MPQLAARARIEDKPERPVMNRKIHNIGAALLLLALAALPAFGAPPTAAAKIDRHALVARHNMTITTFDASQPRDKWTPLQVGNGHFAFGFDATGLQTFMLVGNMSHATLSDWGWCTAPNTEKYRMEEVMKEIPGAGGHNACYPVKGGKAVWQKMPPEEAKHAEGAWNYFRANPGRLPLGQIRFQIKKGDGKLISPLDLKNIRQVLDLWSGIATSSYEVEGVPVEVVTFCHPTLDAVVVRVKSKLLSEGRLNVLLEFISPSGVSDAVSKTDSKWATRVDISHSVGSTQYFTSAQWTSGSWSEQPSKPGSPRRYILMPSKSQDEYSFVCAFAPKSIGPLPDFATASSAVAAHWQKFWQSGGAVDLSASKDPRWKELERRIVLGQYLMAINEAGSSPPQESGLFSNSWNGKFHLEMTAWHGIHAALWGRPELVAGWMDWMLDTGMKSAKCWAESQGYKGIRWRKMIAASAEWEAPSPHGMYWAEVMYRAYPTRGTLERYKNLVQQTAEFMVDYIWFDQKTGRYVLGFPLLTGSEATDPEKGKNSTVELSYWFYGLRTAQIWRERLGLPRETKWDEVLSKLSKPPVVNGLCMDIENASFPNNQNPTPKGKFLARPAMLEAYGCMRGDEINKEAMATTFEKFWKETCDGCQWAYWGCDFPMMAMTAARLGRPKDAVDALLLDVPTNTVLANGFNYAGSTPYLPGTGGILWAVAMMAAGWDGCPDRHAPGFPNDGSWVVKWEGLKKAQ